MSNEKRLFLLFSMRESSTRIPRKMTRSLTPEKTLLEIYLDRLKKLSSSQLFCGSGIAISPTDGTAWRIANTEPVRVIKRTSESIKKRAKLSEIFGFVKDIDATHFMWVNGCHPFLKNSTILSAAALFLEVPSIVSMTSVARERSSFWDNDGVPVHSKDTYRTDSCPCLFRASHCFHIWSKDEVLENDRPWGQTGPNDPHLFEVYGSIENLDADSEEDFGILKAIARSYELQE